MADIVQFPSRARPRDTQSHDGALPPGVKFFAVIEALGPDPRGKPSAFAVVYLEHDGAGGVTRLEAARFSGADLDEAEAFAAEANATWGSGPGPRGAA